MFVGSNEVKQIFVGSDNVKKAVMWNSISGFQLIHHRPASAYNSYAIDYTLPDREAPVDDNILAYTEEFGGVHKLVNWSKPSNFWPVQIRNGENNIIWLKKMDDGTEAISFYNKNDIVGIRGGVMRETSDAGSAQYMDIGFGNPANIDSASAYIRLFDWTREEMDGVCCPFDVYAGGTRKGTGESATAYTNNIPPIFELKLNKQNGLDVNAYDLSNTSSPVFSRTYSNVNLGETEKYKPFMRCNIENTSLPNYPCLFCFAYKTIAST